MDSSFKLISRLLIICLISGILLGFVNSKTSVVIAQREEALGDAPRLEVFADADAFVPAKEISKDEKFAGVTSIYIAKKADQIVGYVLASTVKGYGGDVSTMTGVSSDGKITGFKIGENAETAGIGKRIEEPEFQAQFVGASGKVAPKDEGGTIDSLSGATVSSKAAIQAADLAVQYFIENTNISE